MPEQTKFSTIEELANHFKNMHMSTEDFADLDKDGEIAAMFAQFNSPNGRSDFAEPTIKKSIDMVREFHTKIGAEIADCPSLLQTNEDRTQKACDLLENTLEECRKLATDDDTLLSRLCLSLEETVEWLQSHIDKDLVAAADAIGDRAYVLLGDAVASGMPLQEIFEEIHRSNMSKAESKKGDLGKAAKSDGYGKPDLKLILVLALLNCDGIEEK